MRSATNVRAATESLSLSTTVRRSQMSLMSNFPPYNGRPAFTPLIIIPAISPTSLSGYLLIISCMSARHPSLSPLLSLAQSAYEDELVTVGSHGKPRGRKFSVGRHFVKPVSLEGIVCGCIQGVFYVFAEARVGLIVGVREQHCPLAFREIALEQVKIRVGTRLVTPPRI